LTLSFFVLALLSTASAEWNEKVLYSFQGLPDGATPAGGVVFDKAGNLYGTTIDGGSSSCRSIQQCGTVYQLAPPTKEGDPWTETVLYVFKGNASNDGASPFGGLVIDSAGNLYGTTGYGGTGDCVLLGTKMGCGTVFKLSPPAQKGGNWTETVLYSFPTAKQGYVPWGNLAFDSAGNLYGATEFGGGFGTCDQNIYLYCGAVFELSPPKTKGGKWTEKVLHGFKGGTDGANPNGGLVLDNTGAIYGTTFGGGNESGDCGSGGCGTAFELKPPDKKDAAWTEKRLHIFTGGNDSRLPSAGMILDSAGSLYGATVGTVFRLVPSPNGDWKETILYTFNTEAYGPEGALIFDSNGNLYGTTNSSDVFSGTVFRLKPRRQNGGKWTLAILYGFAGPPDGAQPAANLVIDKHGNLYSTTQKGGTGGCSPFGCGTVFKVSP
jgi:hypothetical protein